MYEIEVKETLSRIIEVKAESPEQAIEKAEEMYKKEIIVLDSSDFQDKEIILCNNN